MKWLYKKRGVHTHVKVYMNGALCGNLVFSNEEFDTLINGQFSLLVDFVEKV